MAAQSVLQQAVLDCSLRERAQSAAAVGSPGNAADALPDRRLQVGAPHPQSFAVLHLSNASALKA